MHLTEATGWEVTITEKWLPDATAQGQFWISDKELKRPYVLLQIPAK